MNSLSVIMKSLSYQANSYGYNLPWMPAKHELPDYVNHKVHQAPPAKSLRHNEDIVVNSDYVYMLPKENPGKIDMCNLLRDTSYKAVGLKRKADCEPKDEKASKKLKLSALWDIKNEFDENNNDTTIPQIIDAVPEGATDFDKETENDIFAVTEYAEEIFQYYQNRENVIQIDKYIHRHPEVSKNMRAVLVDWMVEIQQSFELSHETLYLAVKIVDLYLSKTVHISRDVLQLIGSTAIFIACKFEEHIPFMISDFLYICDDAYTHKEMISMEIKILMTTGFNLFFPLSYRFLRKYAKCSKVHIKDLTLARYILELSLMDYELIDAPDSMLAAAALFLAKVIQGKPTWSQALIDFSGYQIEDICHLVYHLYNIFSQPPKNALNTIRNKYSQKAFFEVSKIIAPMKLDISVYCL